MSLILDGTNGLSDVDGTAATPAIRGTDTNTGIYFGSDIIGFSEGGTQCGEFDASANFKFNSGYGLVATAYGCRAWVNFNGTGTVSIRASANVSSITDNTTGDYTVNFATAMPDANFCATLSVGREFNINNHNICTDNATGLNAAPNTTSIRVAMHEWGVGARDSSFVHVAIFR